MIEITWSMAFIFATVFLVVMAALAFKTFSIIKRYKDKTKRIQRNYQIMLSQKKSSEVRVGKIGEHLAPFLKDWPYDPNRFRFIGNPVDGIQFTDDEVIFIEIKTGKSKLTKSQRAIRNVLRKEGAVSFATFRISENGCALKKDDDDDCDNGCDNDDD